MDTYRLRLTLDAPLAVSDRRDTANRSGTPAAVPPTTVRGALAATVARNGADDSTLDRVFGTTGCRTTALLPVDPDSAPSAEVYPTPLTLRTCKFRGGFRADPTPKERRHGVEDVLFAALHFALYNDGSGLTASRDCARPSCRHVLQPMSGFVRYRSPDARSDGDPGDNRWRSQSSPDTRTQAHVGLDRRRRGAASGILYSREVISEKTAHARGNGALAPTQMQAEVVAPEEVMSTLREALPDRGTLRVGTARSRGLGRCTIERFAEAPSRRSLNARIDILNEAWTASCAAYDHPSPDGVLVPLTLETPALFVDEFLRPSLAPSGADLLQAAHPDETDAADTLANLEPVHQIARPATVQSWNGLADFPHPSAQGLQPGSVLVFRAEEVDDELMDALAHIKEHGIGLRRHFGFGRVRVCDPIHARVHEHTSAVPQAA